MSRLLKGWMSLCLAMGIVATGLPAQASEVVKLARLVVSGKRSATESPRSAPPEPRPASVSSQAHRNDIPAGVDSATPRGVS